MMSRMIVINSCDDCPLCEQLYNHGQFFGYRCKMRNLMIRTNKIPEGCKLPEVPEQITIIIPGTRAQKNFATGWNACVDAILEEGGE